MPAILVAKHGYVRLITINRPDKMNALDFQANEEIIEVWKAFRDDAEARVAVLTGAGDKAFCAGADLKTYTMAFASTPAPEFRRKFTDGPGFGGITRGLEVDKPIIAAVNGFCISGGLELALACDLRFCSPDAEFAHQDVRWGFHPCDGGTVRLPLIVGLGNAMEMILSGERVGAEQSHRIGLVNRIVPKAELLAQSLDYAQKLATRAPLAQRMAKQVVMSAFGRPMTEGLKLESRSFYDLGRTEDLAEGTSAFRERRPANFKAR